MSGARGPHRAAIGYHCLLLLPACTIEEKPLPRPAEQHELVKQGVEQIVEEQAQYAEGSVFSDPLICHPLKLNRLCALGEEMPVVKIEPPAVSQVQFTGLVSTI